jgi:hypothetical protein
VYNNRVSNKNERGALLWRSSFLPALGLTTTNQQIIMNKTKEAAKLNEEKSPRPLARRVRHALFALLVGLVLTTLAWVTARADGGKGATHMRWDLVHLIGNVLSAGGSDSAMAADGSEITLTGSGTWLSVPDDEEPQAVTGGGTWETFDSSGASTGSGTYVVTRLVSFDNAGPNGVPPPALIDTIGSYLDARGGLLVLRVLYSDGERGVLTVSCHGPANVPNTVFEGITATKGIVGYVDRGKPVNGVDGNRTVFHVLPKGHNGD